jgi:murein L,D-transpeptidase YcbB/YkuD
MKSLFDRENRRFSHGCIRIENPLGLVEFIFNDDDNWDAQKVQSAINSGVSNSNVFLKKPIPVHILYFTVWVENDNSIHFRNDVYNFFGNPSKTNNSI